MKIEINEKTFDVYKKFSIENDRLQVFSSGMGTQSTGICALIYHGYLPKPDLIVAADTGRECSQAIEYTKKHIIPMMEEIGVPYIIKHKDSFPELGRLYDLIDDYPDTKTDVLLPMFIIENGQIKKAKGFCSANWKTATVHRTVNQYFGKDVADKRGVDQWIGMSIDEYQRVKYPLGKWQKQYPLVNMALNRQQVINISIAAGLPTPPRSSCYMCPNRRDKEWLEMKKDCPSDFQKAVEVEKYIHAQGYDNQFIHQSGIPLDQVIFTTEPDGQMDMFECSGMCFT